LVYANTRKPFLEGVDDVVQLNFENGDKYEGQIESCIIRNKKVNCMQGIGIYSIQNTHYYQGSFNNNKPDGYGLFSSKNGQSYEGGFKDGSIEGKGVMNYPDGRQYKGNFKNNSRNGYGVMIYPEGRIYGEGSRYEGEWKRNKRDGKGVMIYLDDGRRLEGLFKDNAYIEES